MAELRLARMDDLVLAYLNFTEGAGRDPAFTLLNTNLREATGVSIDSLSFGLESPSQLVISEIAVRVPGKKRKFRDPRLRREAYIWLYRADDNQQPIYDWFYGKIHETTFQASTGKFIHSCYGPRSVFRDILVTSDGTADGKPRISYNADPADADRGFNGGGNAVTYLELHEILTELIRNHHDQLINPPVAEPFEIDQAPELLPAPVEGESGNYGSKPPKLVFQGLNLPEAINQTIQARGDVRYYFMPIRSGDPATPPVFKTVFVIPFAAPRVKYIQLPPDALPADISLTKTTADRYTQVRIVSYNPESHHNLQVAPEAINVPDDREPPEVGKGFGPNYRDIAVMLADGFPQHRGGEFAEEYWVRAASGDPYNRTDLPWVLYLWSKQLFEDEDFEPRLATHHLDFCRSPRRSTRAGYENLWEIKIDNIFTGPPNSLWSNHYLTDPWEMKAGKVIFRQADANNEDIEFTVAESYLAGDGYRFILEDTPNFDAPPANRPCSLFEPIIFLKEVIGPTVTLPRIRIGGLFSSIGREFIAFDPEMIRAVGRNPGSAEEPKFAAINPNACILIRILDTYTYFDGQEPPQQHWGQEDQYVQAHGHRGDGSDTSNGRFRSLIPLLKKDGREEAGIIVYEWVMKRAFLEFSWFVNGGKALIQKPDSGYSGAAFDEAGIKRTRIFFTDKIWDPRSDEFMRFAKMADDQLAALSSLPTQGTIDLNGIAREFIELEMPTSVLGSGNEDEEIIANTYPFSYLVKLSGSISDEYQDITAAVIQVQFDFLQNRTRLTVTEDESAFLRDYFGEIQDTLRRREVEGDLLRSRYNFETILDCLWTKGTTGASGGNPNNEGRDICNQRIAAPPINGGPNVEQGLCTVLLNIIQHIRNPPPPPKEGNPENALDIGQILGALSAGRTRPPGGSGIIGPGDGDDGDDIGEPYDAGGRRFPRLNKDDFPNRRKSRWFFDALQQYIVAEAYRYGATRYLGAKLSDDQKEIEADATVTPVLGGTEGILDAVLVDGFGYTPVYDAKVASGAGRVYRDAGSPAEYLILDSTGISIATQNASSEWEVDSGKSFPADSTLGGLLSTLGGVTDHGALTGLADDDHSAIYYNKTTIDASLAGKSDTGHTHVEADITDLDHDAVKLQGRDIRNVAPSNREFLGWSTGNSWWTPLTLVESDITNLDKYDQSQVDALLAAQDEDDEIDLIAATSSKAAFSSSPAVSTVADALQMLADWVDALNERTATEWYPWMNFYDNDGAGTITRRQKNGAKIGNPSLGNNRWRINWKVPSDWKSGTAVTFRICFWKEDNVSGTIAFARRTAFSDIGEVVQATSTTTDTQSAPASQYEMDDYTFSLTPGSTGDEATIEIGRNIASDSLSGNIVMTGMRVEYTREITL